MPDVRLNRNIKKIIGTATPLLFFYKINNKLQKNKYFSFYLIPPIKKFNQTLKICFKFDNQVFSFFKTIYPSVG